MSQPRFLSSIVVTGRGVIAATGASTYDFSESLKAQRGGIGQYYDVLPDRPVYAGLVQAFDSHPGLDAAAPEGYDRNAAMAAAAVTEALHEAGLWDGVHLGVAGERVALLLGTSHGGRSQLDRFAESGMPADDANAAYDVLERAAHHHQSAVVATLFGIHGPVITTSTACSSSGTAIAHGIELLRSGRADVVIAGGADAFSKLTYAGFSALGAVADGPCGPFSDMIGMTLGEGAAFLVLERESHARARGVSALAGLYGCGSSWDAHHLTSPEPSGNGMYRAISGALAVSGLAAGQVDYINAHATGTRANDISETLAIKRAFDGMAIPPVSATKSFTGHTLGASSAMGFIAGMSAMQNSHLPPTLNFAAARPSCDLDYIANQGRTAEVQHFLAQSAAFGGANCVIAGGQADRIRQPVGFDIDRIVISGMGLISPLGCHAEGFFEALLAGKQAGEANQDPQHALHTPLLARVTDFDPRRQLPPGSGARMDRISQYAIAALNQALKDAGMASVSQRGAELGLMVGLCRGAAASFETYMESVRGGQWGRASPLVFPNLVMSSVGGKAAIALGIKGPASTLVGGADVALSLLANAAEYLLRRSDLDAIAVVVADELTPLYIHLDHTRRGGSAALAPAEGAVAFVLERQAHVMARGGKVHAELAGWAQTFGALTGADSSAGSVWQKQAIRQALEHAGSSPQAIDFVMAVARGVPARDRREAEVIRRVFADGMPALTALAGHTGIAEASGGFFAVAAAVMALRQGCLPAAAGRLLDTVPGYLPVPARGQYTQALVTAASDMGTNSALVLRRHEAAGSI